MYTYQDFISEKSTEVGLENAISSHLHSDLYKIAASADKYDKQQNETILNYIRLMFSMTGSPVEDFTASNNKLVSNFFHRLNTQRCTYLLGNGVSFTKRIEKVTDETGAEVNIDLTKQEIGEKFDGDLKKLAYKALIHGISFGFWNLDKLYVFPVTEFVPLWDEENGSLRAGIRFWRIDKNKPLMIVLYEEDGYTKYRSDINEPSYVLVQEKRPYKLRVSITEADGEEVIGEENYSSLPIIPMWGSSLHQSTLVGMREKIDSFDLIRSGFANDLTDCAQIYWILENAGGMSDADLAKFRDRLKINHIATADTDNSKVTPYTQDIPHLARKEYLDMIRAGIYEDFGGLDVHTVEAGATNDHIDAAYQPLDEEADDFEYQVIEFMEHLLNLIGIDDDPVFKRNRVSNENERTQMVLSASEYLDDRTILSKLPFISVDEVSNILANKDAETAGRFTTDSVGTVADAETVDVAEDVKGQPLNGSQTQSLIIIMDNYAAGKLTEQQATNMIATAISVSKEDARKIVRGEE